LAVGVGLWACGGGGEDAAPGPPAGVSYQVQGLAPASTYHWKVVASDGAARVESQVRSCSTR